MALEREEEALTDEGGAGAHIHSRLLQPAPGYQTSRPAGKPFLQATRHQSRLLQPAGIPFLQATRHQSRLLQPAGIPFHQATRHAHVLTRGTTAARTCPPAAATGCAGADTLPPRPVLFTAGTHPAVVIERQPARVAGHLVCRVQGSFRALGAGSRVQGSGHWERGPGCRVQGTGCGVQGAGFRALGAGSRVQGSGHWVRGPGCRVQGTGCRVRGTGCGVLMS